MRWLRHPGHSLGTKSNENLLPKRPAQAFEVAYRRQSFSAAADELNVTPAAVGQLVKSLEEYLDQPLFIRQTGGKAQLIPTEIAELAIDLQAGRLVRLFPDLACISGLSYYLVYRPEHCLRKKICAFREWLMDAK